MKNLIIIITVMLALTGCAFGQTVTVLDSTFNSVLLTADTTKMLAADSISFIYAGDSTDINSQFFSTQTAGGVFWGELLNLVPDSTYIIMAKYWDADTVYGYSANSDTVTTTAHLKLPIENKNRVGTLETTTEFATRTSVINAQYRYTVLETTMALVDSPAIDSSMVYYSWPQVSLQWRALGQTDSTKFRIIVLAGTRIDSLNYLFVPQDTLIVTDPGYGVWHHNVSASDHFYYIVQAMLGNNLMTRLKGWIKRERY